MGFKSDSASAHNNKGNSLDKLGKYQEAIESFDKAISLDPNLPLFYCNIG